MSQEILNRLKLFINKTLTRPTTTEVGQFCLVMSNLCRKNKIKNSIITRFETIKSYVEREIRPQGIITSKDFLDSLRTSFGNLYLDLEKEFQPKDASSLEYYKPLFRLYVDLLNPHMVALDFVVKKNQYKGLQQIGYQKLWDLINANAPLEIIRNQAKVALEALNPSLLDDISFIKKLAA